MRQIKLATQQITTTLYHYFAAIPRARATVSDSDPQTSLQQYMTTAFANQVANTLGSLAQNFSTVANAALFPNGTTSNTGTSTTTIDQNLLNVFNAEANWLATAAFETGKRIVSLPQKRKCFLAACAVVLQFIDRIDNRIDNRFHGGV